VRNPVPGHLATLSSGGEPVAEDDLETGKPGGAHIPSLDEFSRQAGRSSQESTRSDCESTESKVARSTGLSR
jgi:hypothetical protein